MADKVAAHFPLARSHTRIVESTEPDHRKPPVDIRTTASSVNIDNKDRCCMRGTLTIEQHAGDRPEVPLEHHDLLEGSLRSVEAPRADQALASGGYHEGHAVQHGDGKATNLSERVRVREFL
jgi:hypothetical protein